MSDREVRPAGEYDEDSTPQGGSGTAHTSPEPPPLPAPPPLSPDAAEREDSGVGAVPPVWHEAQLTDEGP